MNVSKFEFEEKHHFLEVDGTQYEIPQRTEKLQKKIREHDEKVQEMTEYEANFSSQGYPICSAKVVFRKENKND